jgi:tetratricopeptide (TPR) repeat protein
MIAIRETGMRRAAAFGFFYFIAVGFAFGQSNDQSVDNRVVFGGPVNADLAAGAESIRAGNYDDGIEQTLAGLADASVAGRNRSAALSNLCAAYAAKELPDTAIRFCTESLAINDKNWRAYSNRSFAYWLKGEYSEAQFDLDTASAMSPGARQVAQIRGMINQMRLRPNIVMEELQ